MSAHEPLPSPYLTDDPPTSSGRTLLATAFAHYCALMWGYSPEEVAQALSDDRGVSPYEHREIRLAARLIGRIVADGRLRTFARPIGGGEPISLKPSVWELDDFTTRFARSAIAVSKPFDRCAEPTHWIFVDTADFDVIIDAATADLPRSPSKPVDVPPARSTAGEGPSAGNERLIRLPEVMHLTGMSRSTVYARMGQGRFPDKVSMAGMAAWRESDIREWLNGPR
jgi:predicted DNA-binding transcriptional regulator AlpA